MTPLVVLCSPLRGTLPLSFGAFLFMTENPVTACVLIIGNEILSGRTQDANLSFIARNLNEHGIQVREARTIPDDVDVIVSTLNEVRAKFDYVFTGGIGPTHDDITADCVARAFGVDLVMHPGIEGLHPRLLGVQRGLSEDVLQVGLRMARVPEGGDLIETEAGAPYASPSATCT